MNYEIVREIPGRIRVRLDGPVPEDDMGALCSLLDESPNIISARVYPLIGSMAVEYDATDGARSRVLDFLAKIERDDVERMRQMGTFSASSQMRGLLLDIAWLVGTYLVRRWLLPQPLSMVINTLAFVPFARQSGLPGAGRPL